MTVPDKIAWLESYGALNRRIDAEMEKLERLCAVACKSTTTISDMPGGGSDRQSVYVAVADLAGAVGDLWRELGKLGADIDKAVRTLPDARERAMLVCRYIYGYSIRKLSRAYGMSRYHVRRVLSDAVQRMVVDVTDRR